MRKLLPYLLLIATLTSYSQESIIKEFSEPKRSYRWLNPICLYPSTLRMINISGDPEFYELVNDIEKILIYNLDSATIAAGEYTSWIKDYEKVGFEEYISLYGKQTMKVYGKEDEFIGLMQAEDRLLTFYLRGEIPFHKIPELINSFREEDLLGLVTDQFK